MKDFLLVSIGSFFGGGARYLVSQAVQSLLPAAFPAGTMSVNVLGCLIIGFLSALPWGDGVMSPSIKLLLTTGFCGGFTTFSTFMNEGSALMKDGHWMAVCLYVAGSIVMGLLAVMGGRYMCEHLIYTNKNL